MKFRSTSPFSGVVGRVASSAVVGLTLLLTSSSASAHIALMYPATRNVAQKNGPCGNGVNQRRGTNVTTLRPGQTITVRWTETVPHPGHFRISFDPDGQNDFKDPVSFTDIQRMPTLPILVDGIADKSGTMPYSQSITLPNMECTTCTLQVIQVMTDKPPYGNGDDIYYQCADLILSNNAPIPDGGTQADGGVEADTGRADVTMSEGGVSGMGGTGGAGVGGNGGSAAGGSGGSGATGGTGGQSSGSGGSTAAAGSGGSRPSTGGAGGDTGPPSRKADDGGCAVGGGRPSAIVALGLALFGAAVVRLRRRRR